MPLRVDLNILNQKGTPAFYSDTFANRPAAGFAGRVFISTDTGAIYEDTGTTWTLIADAGAGTTGTLQQVTTNGNTTTLAISVEGLTIGRGGGSDITNTAIGYLALASNTTGTHNLAVGYNSLNANTIGSDNTAIGHSSMPLITAGSTNTAIGAHTLENNTNGSGNTAMGWSNLILSTGDNNTSLGQSSGGDLTTGSNNTILGYNTGRGLTTGSNNTIIGNSVTLGTGTNSHIVLADGSGNIRIYSNGSGLIGINQAVTNTPSAQLDIHSTQTYILGLNGTGTANSYTGYANAGTFKWRLGNTYNAGANTFDIYNIGSSSLAFSINNTTNNILISGATDNTVDKLQVNGSTYTTGVAFPSTQVPSSNVNTLDDYKEGTFVPTVTGSTTAGTCTYTARSAQYTKIGNTVYFRIDIIWTGHTGTGCTLINGLPYPIGSNYMVCINVRTDQTITALNYVGGSYIYNSRIELQTMPVGGGTPNNLNITANADLRVSGFYFV